MGAVPMPGTPRLDPAWILELWEDRGSLGWGRVALGLCAPRLSAHYCLFFLASGLPAKFILPDVGPGHPEGAFAGQPNPGRGGPLHAE